MIDSHESALAQARSVAQALAEDALERDRAGKDPVAEVALLRDAGLPALLIPRRLGGAGQSWSTALAVVREIARADGSIAQLLGYHYVNLHNLWWSAGPEAQERYGRPSAERQWFWGDAVNPLEPELALRPDPDRAGGHLLHGTKSFATGASVGDIVLASGQVTGGGEQFLVVVPAGTPGMEFGGDWDHLGQRLSASGSVRFDRVPIAPEQLIAPMGREHATARGSLITPAAQAVFGHFYLGIAEGALATAREYTRTVSRPWVLSDAPTAAADPYRLADYGELASRLAATGALADRIAAHLDRAVARGAELSWPERGALAVEVSQLKVVATETALDTTTRVFELTGARATANRQGLDRFWRNVRTHTLHDPVAYKRREVGDHYLNGAMPPFSLYT